MTGERTLTQRELNRALLARQLLLERASLPAVRALERVAGLQAQDAPSPYLGLWARLDGFERQELTRALYRRTAVKATLMRTTLHLVSARDYALFLPALMSAPPSNWEAIRRVVPDARRLARRARAFAHLPRTTGELRPHLGDLESWWRVTLHTPFIRAPTGDDWAFEQKVAWVAAEHWLERPFGSAQDGLVHMLRRYLAAFGPATVRDAAAWSGLSVATLAPVAEALAPGLRRFRDEHGRTLLDVRGAPLPDPDTPAPARLLPTFDNALLAHGDRTRIVSDDHRRILGARGMADSVFLVDGFVAGTWRLAAGKVALEAFGRLSAAARRALVDEGERLAAFVA